LASELLLGLALGILTSFCTNIWVEQMFRYIDKKESWIRFGITTIVMIILIIFLYSYALVV